MLNSNTNYSIKFYEIFFIFAILMGINIIFLNRFDNVIIPVSLLAISLSIVYYYFYINDIPTFLIFISFIEFIYIEKAFSRHFQNVVAQNIFLYILVFIFIIHFLFRYDPQKSNISISKVGKSIVFFFVYFSIMMLLGILKGYSKTNIIIEYYQLLYYLLFFPIIYFFNNRDNYIKLIILLIFISFLISLQYIYYNLTLPIRFITVHNLFFPFSIALIVSFFYIKKDNIILKVVLTVFTIIILIGSFFIAARALWVAILVTYVTYYMIRLLLNKNAKLRKTKIILILLIISGFMGYFVTKKANVKFQPKDVKDRIESLSDPLEDKSFLMRVEINILGIQRVMQNPVLGEGLGNTIQFQFLENTKVTFPDNSFLYFLWKGGIIGLILFSLILFQAYKTIIYIIQNSTEPKIIEIMIGIFSGLTGFVLLGLLQANFIAFRVLLVFIFILAYVEFEKKIIDEKSR